MRNREKKVIVFIAEGPSDEAALGTIMKEFFIHEEIKFMVVHGDITTRDYVDTDAIIAKINTCLESIKEKYRYEQEDFQKIIHLVDLDGVYVPDSCIKQADVKKIKYHSDHIETNNVPGTITRNHKKGQILFKLRRTGKINKIPYKVYYMSCNLEHVLYNELAEYTDGEKERMADEFAEMYEGKVDDFVQFISNPLIAVAGNYQDTWKFIERDFHSLNRYTNIHLVFDNKH